MTLGDRICVMNDGYLQQIGEPVEVYDYPANKFVAGFIGTPPMNFFEGEIADEDGARIFRAPGIRIQLDGRLKEAVEQHAVTGEATYGIRPESMRMCEGEPSEADRPLSFKATVDVIEKLGDEQLVYCSTENANFVIKADAHRPVEVEQRINVVVDLDRSHIFAGENEENITAPTSPAD